MRANDFELEQSRGDQFLKLLRTLRGHTALVCKNALSPDGKLLASSSHDSTVRLWDVKTGQFIRALQHEAAVFCVDWSPDGATLASGSCGPEMKLTIWDTKSGHLQLNLEEHSAVNSVAWSPDGKMLASGSDDGMVRLWDASSGDKLVDFQGHTGVIEVVTWSPDGDALCSCSSDGTARLWDTKTRTETLTLTTRPNDACRSVAWSSDRKYLALASTDRTVRIWDADIGKLLYILEGHTDVVASVSFIDHGRLLASLGRNGTVIIWRSDRWSEVAKLVGQSDSTSGTKNIACHTHLPIVALLGRHYDEINLWNIELATLGQVEPAEPTTYCVNAKAVLLGDSGVGKSGLGIRLAEGVFRPTEGSTHGAQFWHFPTAKLRYLPASVQGELTLWDLAGQPEYRLIHQLFLDDTDAAVLLFDCSDPDDPFHGIPYWAKVLKKQCPPHVLKFLVSARCDVSTVTVDRREINSVLAEYGLDGYFKTSARTGEGIEQLFETMIGRIPWDQLPRTSRPRLFQVVREFLLERKQEGLTLISMDNVMRSVRQLYTESTITRAELDTVVQLLQSNGLLFRINPILPDDDFSINEARLSMSFASLRQALPSKLPAVLVLLKPELIEQYGGSVIQAARNNLSGIGATTERDVLTGRIPFTGFVRLPAPEERLVLEATVELVVRHDLCFREMGYLVFPSQINVNRLPASEGHPRTDVAYRFSGSIETIFASLVVRLSYTDYFHREGQWKYAVEFSRNSVLLGFSMRQIEEGTGELEIYFYPGITEFDRVTFIRFITDHLRTKGINIEEHIRLYCPKCSEEITNRDAIESRVAGGNLDIPCQYCTYSVMIPRSIEERYRRDPSLIEKQQQLVKVVESRTDAEVTQFRSDQQQYASATDTGVHILHLSDIHLRTESEARVYRTQLESDLLRELNIQKLDYLIISGDIAHRATEDEYRAAFAMIDGIVKQFGLDSAHVVVVPGNHDVNWDASETAYRFVPKSKLPELLPDGKYVRAGDAGVLLRDDELYRLRFANFNAQFYKRVYPGREYPLDYSEQTLLVTNAEDRILFLGLNSCWQLDHQYPGRAGIYIEALTRALDGINVKTYDNWLKVAVFHHPITGKEMINDDFVQLLSVHGFQVCIHGHLHEAIESFYRYDSRRGIHIIGGGTFGAPSKEHTSGIPLQYNLLTLARGSNEIVVNTRRKEKPNGAWAADARWGDKNHPSPIYNFRVEGFRLRTH